MFLNPSGDRKNVCHFMVNANGVLCDGIERRKGGEWTPRLDVTWESGAKVDVEMREDGYSLTIAIPISAFGDDVKDRFPAEFCRNRIMKNGKGNGHYVWGEYTLNYKDVSNYGILDISR